MLWMIFLAALSAGLLPPPDSVNVAGTLEALRSPEAKPFVPGVWINWAARQVEVEAYVVLREGMLELFACSPQTKEHESILRVEAQPTHIYQAVGLLGIEGGRPPYWDPVAQQGHAATGSRLTIDVRYQWDGEVRTDKAHRWMRNARNNEPAPPTQWIFSGSVQTGQGRLTADMEGTVICLVDFESALISLPQSYSANNDMLWLAPNADRIPPLGSPCMLLLKAVPDWLRTIRLGRYGELSYDGMRTGRLRLEELLRRDLVSMPDLTLELLAAPSALQQDVAAILEIAREAGLPAGRLTITQEPAEPVAALDVDGLVTLWRRKIDLPRDMFHNMSTALELVRGRLRAIAEMVRSEVGPLRQALDQGEPADAGEGGEELPPAESKVPAP